MGSGIYLVVFAVVLVADQLSKRWAVRALPVADSAGQRLAWTLTRCRSFERLGGRRVALIWAVAGTGGAALCLAASPRGVAAIGGVAAWAAAASNMVEWWQRGAVVDWIRLWPRSLTNLADAVLIVGTALLIVSIGAA